MVSENGIENGCNEWQKRELVSKNKPNNHKYGKKENE